MSKAALENWGVPVLLPAVALALILFFASSCKGPPPSDEKEVRGRLVTVAPVPRALIRSSFTLTGNLEPRIDVTLSSEIAGKVMQVPVNEGDRVVTGQPLALVDDRELKASLSKLNARLIAEKANLEKLKRITRPQEFVQLKARVDSAKVALENAKRDLERANELFDAGVIALSEVERARAAREAAQAAYTSAVESLDLALEGTREEDIISAEAAIKGTEAEMQLVRLQIEKYTITAPADGIVSKVYVDPSELVSPGAPVCDFVNLTYLEIKIGLSESDLIAVQPGHPVAIRLKLAPDQPIPGVVTAVSPNIDPVSGTFEVEITVPNPGEQIMGGFFAEVEFTRAVSEDAIVVPLDVVINVGEKWHAFIVNAGRAEKREVQIGIITATHAEILEGIEEGELIVTVGQRLLSDGDLVEISETAEIDLPPENEFLEETLGGEAPAGEGEGTVEEIGVDEGAK